VIPADDVRNFMDLAMAKTKKHPENKYRILGSLSIAIDCRQWRFETAYLIR